MALNPNAPPFMPFSLCSFGPPFHCDYSQTDPFFSNQNPTCPRTTIYYYTFPNSPSYSQMSYYYYSPYSTFHSFFRVKQPVELASNPTLIAPVPVLEETKEVILSSLSEKEAIGGDMSKEHSNSSEMQVKERKGEEMEGERAVVNVRWCWKPKGLVGSTDHDHLAKKAASWKPRSRRLIRRKQLLSSTTSEDQLEFQMEEEKEGEYGHRTTVMIKNIPSRFTKKRLLELLDDHCMKENEKLEEGDEKVTFSEFDFLYLPMDFSSGNSLGYAFVNFTSSVAAWRLHRDFQKKGWSDEFGSRKVCEVSYARVQGLAALLNHFKDSVFFCERDDYLPVYFTPSRNGLRQSEERCVGKRYSA